ncbi:MAG: DUF4340 domain-containing protein [Desulfobacterales bacterium]|nr:DUF4340 domain-containing protein [Desulfobacterales bacterium]
MKITKEYAILFSVIIACILYLSLHSGDRTHFELPEFGDIDKDAVTSIEICTPDKCTVLNKSGDEWLIGDEKYPADEDVTRRMLNVINDLKVTSMASASGNYKRYNLSDDQANIIRAFARNKLIREFTLGKVASTRQHSFIKLPDDQNVYYARGHLKPLLVMPLDRMRNREILSFDTAAITQVAVLQGDESHIFTRRSAPVPDDEDATRKEVEPETENTPKSEFSWFDEKGTELVLSKAQKLLNQLSKMNCTEYIYDKTKDELTDSIKVFKAMDGEKEYTLSIFEKPEQSATYPAVSSENPYPFTLSKMQIETLEEVVRDVLGLEEEVKLEF